jgi:hypothetical protein
VAVQPFEDEGEQEPDGVVTHLLNPFRSGAARFNQVLAARMGVPCVGIHDERASEFRNPLFSFKVGELTAEDRRSVSEIAERCASFRLYLHDHDSGEFEAELVARAEIVYCGNAEVEAAIKQHARAVRTLWAPGLISDTRRFEESEITVFSFGMAHKIQVERFRHLRRLLEASGRSYAIYISNANHETATLADAEIVFEEMHGVFPSRLYFTGNLSDVAIYNWIVDTTFFAAFFPNGARANNTSIASAMEQGAVVLTNLDEYSPPYMRHLETVIDLDSCDELPTDPELLQGIRDGAREAASRLTWEALIEAVQAPPDGGGA